MRQLTVTTAAMALMVSASLASAEDIKSGLQVGKQIGAFNVTKLAGAEDDGVKEGGNLCYRCKNGGRPQVMIFTRSSDKAVVTLVQKLDAAIAKNSGKELRAFVNFLGDEKSSAKAKAEKLAKASKVKKVPFVLPNEFENGPADYGINPKAAVTVILAEGGKVKANHAAGSAADLNVDAIIADLAKILD
jgi:hypothetical protein